MAVPFPFAAIVGQDDMLLALQVAAVDPSVGGVLILGDRGTGKSTAVRALAALLPKIAVTDHCPYNCLPDASACAKTEGCPRQLGRAVKGRTVTVPVVDLPLGVTEDRVVGALDIEKALTKGEKAFEPGLLARANRGFLYIDEVNLLEDHIVDLLLDAAASGETVVEREGLSVRHPSRFVLVGSGNPEEGDLRPQMLDRFGLAVTVSTPKDVPTRVAVVKRRDAYDRDPAGFAKRYARKQSTLRKAIAAGQERLDEVQVPDGALELAASLCLAIGTDGLRGELTLMRAGRALAALEGADLVGPAHIRRIAPMVLSHRLRRDPLDEAGGDVRVARALESVLGVHEPAA